MVGIVVVFDFDKTIIDCDSDNWVLDGFNASDHFDRLLLDMPWNSAMDKMMTEIHSQGITVQQIADRLKTAPIDPHIIEGIKSAYALGCELRIVSDANLFYIKTILDHHGLTGYFSEINTNPGYVDEEGKLRIFPYHDFHTSSHGCQLCPPNMCKSVITKRVLKEAALEKKRIIYLGDGKGDYCPSLNLTEMDHVMPRKNYPIWDLICDNPWLLKAEIHEWSNGEEQKKVLLGLIHLLLTSSETTDQLDGIDTKFQIYQQQHWEAMVVSLRLFLFLTNYRRLIISYYLLTSIIYRFQFSTSMSRTSNSAL